MQRSTKRRCVTPHVPHGPISYVYIFTLLKDYNTYRWSHFIKSFRSLIQQKMGLDNMAIEPLLNSPLLRSPLIAGLAIVVFISACLWVYFQRNRIQKPDLRNFEVTDGNVVAKLEEAHREVRLAPNTM